MNITEFTKCANCGACLNKCPTTAISIDTQSTFYFPVVDSELCIDCGACTSVCPVNQSIDSVPPLSAYAGWHHKSSVVLSSSSGGAFWGLAQSVLNKQGVVFGAVYASDYKTVHFTSTDNVPLQRLQKSKYVESLVGLSFQAIQNELNIGRQVLFCGTPCQVAGLKLFLNRDYDNLLTCDFACGGLPSHAVYEDYVKGLEVKYNSILQSMDFRPKTYGWHRYAVLAKFQNGKKYSRLGREDPFLKSFLYGKYTVRDYCLECTFSDHHMADITIADFWLYKQFLENKNSDGISLILCNTSKGESAVTALCNDFSLISLDVFKVSYNHKPTNATEEQYYNRARFIEAFRSDGLVAAYRRFFHTSTKQRIINWISRCVHYRFRGK